MPRTTSMPPLILPGNRVFGSQASAQGIPPTPVGRHGNAMDPVQMPQVPQTPRDTQAPPAVDDRRAFLEEMTAHLRTFLRDASVTATRPAHVDPNYWSPPIDLAATVNVPGAVMPPGAWTTAISFVVPSGNWFRLQGYGMNVRDPAYTYNGSLLWRITVDGIIAQNLGPMQQQRGTLANPRPTFLVVQQDKRVTFDVRRDLLWGVAQDVEMALNGYLWVPRNEYDGARLGQVF